MYIYTQHIDNTVPSCTTNETRESLFGKVGRRFSAPLICICWKYKFSVFFSSLSAVESEKFLAENLLRGSTLLHPLNRRTHIKLRPLLLSFFRSLFLVNFIFFWGFFISFFQSINMKLSCSVWKINKTFLIFECIFCNWVIKRVEDFNYEFWDQIWMFIVPNIICLKCIYFWVFN